jgi:hypothetical protein
MPILHQVRVPVDDVTSMHFRCYVHPERPLTPEEIATFEGGIIIPEIALGSFETVENMDNDYRIDRTEQSLHSYTGIKSIVAQDLAVTQDQGGLIADRSRELLVSSDRAIIMLRKRLLTAAKALAQGIEPPEADGTSVAVRPGDFILARDVPLEAGARELHLV